MSDLELKRYMLAHREDKEAFYADLDRRHSRSNKISIEFEDPAWEEKILSVIETQVNYQILTA
jgi:hypothetical protein